MKISTTYENLTYFRWKALIRSKEYRKFCKKAEIDTLQQERENLEYEIWEKKQHLGCSVDEHLDSFEEYGRYGDEDFNVECEELVSELETIEGREDEIIMEAEERFGLIVFDFQDLKPEEKQIDKLLLTFTEYVPALPEKYFGSLKKHRKEFIVKLLDSERSNTDWFNKDSGYKLLAVNFKMPRALLISEIQKILDANSKKRSDRKDFTKWHEAFEVWDLQKKNKNFLLTAKAMAWKNNSKSEPYSDEELRGRAHDKYKVADELINLAGKGHFKGI